MEYVTVRRARFESPSGPVNIPWGTKLELADGFLVLDGITVCAATSQNAHDYFARNDDGHGLERGRLTAAVIGRLAKRDLDHQKRWNLVWSDRLCQKYRRRDYVDFWLWSHDFFEAPIKDLRHIAELVGASGKMAAMDKRSALRKDKRNAG